MFAPLKRPLLSCVVCARLATDRPPKQLRPLLDADVAALCKLKAADCAAAGAPNDGVLNAWDRSFYCKKLEEQHYEVDHEKLREYFPIEAVLDGLLAIYQVRVVCDQVRLRPGASSRVVYSVLLFRSYSPEESPRLAGRSPKDLVCCCELSYFDRTGRRRCRGRRVLLALVTEYSRYAVKDDGGCAVVFLSLSPFRSALAFRIAPARQ